MKFIRKLLRYFRPKPYVDVYLNGVDWQHEIGETKTGTKVYGDVNDLARQDNSATDCGIVKVRVTFIKWAYPQKPIKEWRR